MHVYFNTANVYSKKFTQKQPEINYQAKNSVTKNICKKVLIPSMFAMMIPLGLLQYSNRISEKTNLNGQKIEYFQVKHNTKEAIEEALLDFRAKAQNTEFLDGINIDVTQNYSKLDEKNSFRRSLKSEEHTSNICGTNFYSDSAIPKYICIQEDVHRIYESPKNSIKFTLMHELGHQFDKFYGHDHNADFAIAYDKMLARNAALDSSLVYTRPSTLEDMTILYEYGCKNGLSDKSEFKNAFKKDLQNIAEIKQAGNKTLAKNLNYFLSGIKLEEKITDDVVNFHDASRAEVYANLFSYATGENNGDKEAFLNNFQNSYKVVKKDIKNFLGF